MNQFKYLDSAFLDNLKKDTAAIDLNLIPELFKIFFEVYPVKLNELSSFLLQNQEAGSLKVAHFLKGQSACTGLSYCMLPQLKEETEKYVNQIK